MFGRHRQFLIFIAGVIVATGLLLALLLPSLISALPSQVRGRLPEEVIRAVTTPLPTALPAPIQASAATPIPVAQLLSGTATLEPTAVPMELPSTPTRESTLSATASPPATVAIEETVVVTATATPLPTASPSPSPSPTITNTPRVTATPSPIPLPEDVHISGLTIVPQKFNNCGSANLSVVLDYYGAPDTQTDIAGVIKPHYDDRNVTPEELVAYVNEKTELQAAVYRGGDLDLLRRIIQAGFPVIIEKGYEPDAWQGWMGHYLTLIGYDDREETFTSLDTYLGPWDSSGRPASYDELAFRWAQFNNTFLVVYHPFDEAQIAGLLGPGYLQPEQMWQNAAAAAEKAAADQPDDAFAWFNLGASLAELAKLNDDAALYSAAATAFDQSRIVGLPPRMMWYQFQPYEAYIHSDRIDEALALAAAVMQSDGGWHVEESHYYQGLAYLASGNTDLARSAFKRALDIKPGYREAQAELDGLS
ncbi:MAG: C39 family peptidase [Candidatus Promineifilaceae bacterium]